MSAADLQPLIHLQADSSKQEEKSTDFPSPPELPLDEPLPADETGGPPLNPPESISTPQQEHTNLDLNLLSTVVTNSDITSAIPTEETAFINGAMLQAKPKLGPQTNLIADIGGNLVRFTESDGYNSLDTKLGVEQQLGKDMSGQLAWVRTELFGIGETGDLVENGVLLKWSREDLLSGASKNRLTLNSDFEVQAIFSEPDPDFLNRISLRPEVAFRYNFTPKLQGQLGYRFIFG